jgi:hypothetical protein
MMKSLACLLLFVAILPATAQKCEIIGFDHSGTLTWSNSLPPLYCGVEAKWDLRHTWLPLGEWNLLVTSSVTNSTVPGDALWDQLDVVLRNLTGDGLHAMFFRVVVSPSPLGPRYATNVVHVTNASTSVLDNITVGLKHGEAYGSALTNFPSLLQDMSMPGVAVQQEIVFMSGAITNVITPLLSWPFPVQDGWYLSYDQAGSNRLVESMVVPFGDPEKNVGVTVSTSIWASNVLFLVGMKIWLSLYV